MWTCDVLELDGVVAVVGSRVIYWRCRGSSPTFRSYSKVGDGRLVESTRVRAPRHVDARCGLVDARVMLRQPVGTQDRIMVANIGHVELALFLMEGGQVVRVDTYALGSEGTHIAHDIFGSVYISDRNGFGKRLESKAVTRSVGMINNDSFSAAI